MNVPMFDLNRRIDRYRNQLQQSFEELLDSGNVILGNQVREFEREFAIFLGVDHCVGVGNGTDAIEIALKALELKQNSYVLTVANAGGYATTSILNSGLKPRYVDIDSETGNVSLEQFIQVDLSNVSAVVFTHLYGNPIGQIDKLVTYFHSRGIRTLEDCAQAHGAQYMGKTLGTFAEISTFSFYPTKNLGCLGDGGAIATSDYGLATRATKLRTYGWSSKYKIELGQGRNSRLDEIQAAFLRNFLPLLEQDNSCREKIANHYRSEIHAKNVHCLKVDSGMRSSNHQFPLLTEKRDLLVNHLEKLGVATSIHYPVLDIDQKPFYTFRKTLMQSEIFSKSVLSIPIFPEMRDEEVAYVVDSVNSFT